MTEDREFSVKIVDRGDSVEYREGDRMLHAAISSSRGETTLYTHGLHHWVEPDEALLSPTERDRVLNRLVAFLEQDRQPVRLNNSPPQTTEEFLAERKKWAADHGWRVTESPGKLTLERPDAVEPDPDEDG